MRINNRCCGEVSGTGPDDALGITVVNHARAAAILTAATLALTAALTATTLVLTASALRLLTLSGLLALNDSTPALLTAIAVHATAHSSAITHHATAHSSAVTHHATAHSSHATHLRTSIADPSKNSHGGKPKNIARQCAHRHNSTPYLSAVKPVIEFHNATSIT